MVIQRRIIPSLEVVIPFALKPNERCLGTDSAPVKVLRGGGVAGAFVRDHGCTKGDERSVSYSAEMETSCTARTSICQRLGRASAGHLASVSDLIHFGTA